MGFISQQVLFLRHWRSYSVCRGAVKWYFSFVEHEFVCRKALTIPFNFNFASFVKLFGFWQFLFVESERWPSCISNVIKAEHLMLQSRAYFAQPCARFTCSCVFCTFYRGGIVSLIWITSTTTIQSVYVCPDWFFAFTQFNHWMFVSQILFQNQHQIRIHRQQELYILF